MKRWMTYLVVAGLGCGPDSGPSSGDAAGSGSGAEAGSTTGGDSAGASGSDDGVPTTGAEAGETTEGPPQSGCDGIPLRPVPIDPTQAGPWPVGARSATVAGLSVEVWYPAQPGSEAGVDPVVYDIREALPPAEQVKISDEDNPWQDCDCYRELPVDDEHGPYPLIVFAHGTAGFRTQSLELATHWVSRGFVVVAADHPGLWLADLLGGLPGCGGGGPPQDVPGDLAALLDGFRSGEAALEFVLPHVDISRIGMVGHSAGGTAISGLGGQAQVLVPMAAGGTQAGAALRSTLVIGGQADTVVAYSQQVSGYEAAPAPKRLVGLGNAGHLAFSSICALRNAAGQGLLEVANMADVCGASLAGFLFDCSEDYLPDDEGWAITNGASAAAFEETLHCRDLGSTFDDLQLAHPALLEFRQEP